MLERQGFLLHVKTFLDTWILLKLAEEEQTLYHWKAGQPVVQHGAAIIAVGNPTISFCFSVCKWSECWSFVLLFLSQIELDTIITQNCATSTTTRPYH